MWENGWSFCHPVKDAADYGLIPGIMDQFNTLFPVGTTLTIVLDCNTDTCRADKPMVRRRGPLCFAFPSLLVSLNEAMVSY